MEIVLHDQPSVTKGVLCMFRSTYVLPVIPRILTVHSIKYK